MLHRAFAVVLFATTLLLAPARIASGQELLPREREALAARAAGDHAGATTTFLQLLTEQAQRADGAVAAARIEAWATIAARLTRPAQAGSVIAAFDALATAPAVAADPLLADRLALLALELAESLPKGNITERAQKLGFVSGGWLLGPLPNERGNGFAKAFEPETAFDLTAELPGKVRPVRWREVPHRDRSPVLPVQRIVHPHEQSLVYFATAVLAQADTEAVLELGSTGSWAVFCNGNKVGAREIERPFAFDQDTVVVPLVAGPNLLLLKACHQEGADFLAALRLRARSGQPLAGVRFSALRADVEAAAQTKAATPTAEATAVALGGRSTLPIGSGKGADALRLAWLWRARDADGDRDGRRDRAAAVAATTELPDVADAWLALAATHLRHGRSAADRDENDRRRALERALQKSPGHVDAAVQLGNLLRDSSGLWRQARALADSVLAQRPNHPAAALLRIATWRDEGMPEFADAELRLLAEKCDHPDAWRLAASAADRDPAVALRLRQQVLTLSCAEFDFANAASQLARLGQTDGAKELLRTAMAADPCSGRFHRQLAELLLVENDYSGARQTMDRWLQLAVDDADAMSFAARILAQGRHLDPNSVTREIELLRSALQVAPNRRDDERRAEYLERQQAGSAGTEASGFHVPWQVDATALVRADTGPPADAAAARDPLHWLLRQQIVRANQNGTTNVYRHDIVRVLTTDGARQLSQWQMPYYGGEQRARLLGCTVFRADGSVQKPALQGARVRLPDLRPGDVVAVEGRVDDLQPSFFGDYFGLVHVFRSPDGSPVRTDDLLVLAAPGRDYRWQNAQGAPAPEEGTLADGTRTFRFVLREIARDRPEVQRPLQREREPVVRMTTYRDWDQFAAWWWNLIKNQLEVTPAMQQTVRERTAGLASLDDKIAAIYHFVTTDVRYEAWEFGVHGYKPYATSVIHERRHGDCKDKALLLCALLGEIGVPCRPVLIFADPLRSKDDLELPMVQHFNHCIAWLPPHEGRPGRFLDGTATWHPTDTLPDMDQGAAVLVVDGGKAELRGVPWATPKSNRMHDDFVVELGADGKVSLRHTQRPLGNAAVELRSMLATEPARRREVVERTLAETFGTATLGELNAPAAGPEAAVELGTQATIAELGQRTDTTWQLPSVFADTGLLALTAEAERHSPLLLGVPRGEASTLRYVLPPGFRPGELPTAVEQQAPFGSFTMRWRRDGSAVVVERELQMTRARIEPQEYAAFRDFVGAVKAADSQLVLLQKEGSR